MLAKVKKEMLASTSDVVVTLLVLAEAFQDLNISLTESTITSPIPTSSFIRTLPAFQISIIFVFFRC